MIKEKIQELLLGRINFEEMSKTDENYDYYEQSKEILKNNNIISYNYKEIMTKFKDATLVNEYVHLMKDIRTDLLYHSIKHGINHNIRVSIFALIICIFEDIKREDFSLIIEAAKYHDIGRENDFEDGEHGFRSSQMISFLSNKYTDEELNCLRTIITCHSLPDANFDIIAKKNEIKDIERTKKLFNILKDSDALDRVRLEYPFIKIDMLRTTSAKKLILFAYELYFNYKKWLEESYE